MKKSKTILLIISLAVNLLLVQIFKIKITFQQVLIIQIFLFSLSFLADIIQLKYSKNKNIYENRLKLPEGDVVVKRLKKSKNFFNF